MAKGELISPEHKKSGPRKGQRPLWEQEAVELGLIDEIGGLSDALGCLYGMMGERDSSASSWP